MAMSLRNQENLFLKDSDEVVEMFCEHCEKLKNTIVTADAFCADCCEYMCSNCKLYHDMYKDGHTLKGKDKMPQDYCTDKCPTHSKELIKFYCKNCDMVACIECKKNIHKKCYDLKYIPNLVHSASFDEEIKRIQYQSDQLIHGIQTIDENTKSCLEFVDKNKDDVIVMIETRKNEIENEIENQRLNVIEVLNRKRAAVLKQLEEEKRIQMLNFDVKQNKIKTTLDAIKVKLSCDAANHHKSERKKLMSLSSNTDALKKKVIALQHNVKTKSSGTKCSVFVAMKQGHWDTSCSVLTYDTERMIADICVNCIDFSPNKETININSSTEEINVGQLVANSKFKVKRRPEFTNEIFKMKYPLTLEGLCKISETKLALVCSSDVTVIDTSTYKALSQALLTSAPNSVTKTNTNQLAILLPKEYKIRILVLTSNDKLETLKDIHISCDSDATGTYLGITYCYPKNILVVDCHRVKGLKTYLIDMNGSVQTRAKIDCIHNEKTTVVFCTNSKTLYLASGSIVRHINLEGNTLHKKEFNAHISSLAVDMTGAVYVSLNRSGFDHSNILCNYKATICQLSSDLRTTYEIGEELLASIICVESDINLATVDEFSVCMYYCNKENKLYVGVFDRVMVYKMR